jgi:hypothetical protein
VEIAKMAKVQTQSVSAWFAGRTNNKNIEDCVIMYVIEERKDRERKLKSIGML